MKSFRLIIPVSVSAVCAVMCGAPAFADTIVTNDGKEIKGIVVEDYRDRVVFSTVDGEITVMKPDMRELSFDSEEDNLVKLAEQALERRDYSRAMGYYEMALKISPDSAAVKQGMAYLRGSYFRKEESLKEAAIKRQQDIELYGNQAAVVQNTDEIGDMTRTLEKATGIRLAIADNMPKIEALKSPSPAYEAGLRRGDVLVSVWGKLTGYLSLKEILDLLINKSAIEIRCTVERASDVEINPNKSIISGIEDLIGAAFAMELDGLTISSVKEGGFAARAGLQADDLIMSIDGKHTRYMTLKKAVELIKNSKEGAVKLVIRRKTIIWRSKEL